jgi:hypothetical protein
MRPQSRHRTHGVWDEVILPRAAEIVRSYDTGVTLRQLQLVSEGTIRNTRAEYSQLSKRTAKARREGWFPALLDRERNIIVPAAWESPKAARDALRDQYRRDRTEGQEWSVYLGIEKSALAEQLSAWFGQPLGLPILPLRGYQSETFERVIETHRGGVDRPSVLLYAGDLDPSGEDIFRNLLQHTDFDKSKRVALTVDQAVEYDLPPMPGKEADVRAATFVAKHGRLFQIEVDALAPDVLRSLFADAIAEHWDDAIHHAVVAQETAERGEL